MARNPAGKTGGIWLRTVLFGVLATGGIAAAAVILQPMLAGPSADVALIKAEPGPFREEPKDPGGMKIQHQDSTVMTMLGGVVKGDEDVEILRPPADVPEMPPLPDKPDEKLVMAPSPAPVRAGGDGMPAAGGMAIETGNAGTGTPSEKADGTVTETTETPDGSGTAMIENAGAEGEDQTPAPTVETEVTATALLTMPKSKPAPPKRPSVEGDEPLYLVQLAAFRNADTAREQAAMLVGKHQSRLGGVDLGTMKVDAGENGIFWRVITEPLDRTEADGLCAALKRAGQDCILRKFDDKS